jgi:hypothetical protein
MRADVMAGGHEIDDPLQARVVRHRLRRVPTEASAAIVRKHLAPEAH